MMKKIVSIVLSFVLAFVLYSTQVSAKDKNNTNEEKHVKNTFGQLSVEDFAKKYWAPWGMDKATQQKLINKIKRGEKLDADRPEIASKAKVETFQQINDEGVIEKVTKSIYPDGSISVTTEESPDKLLNGGVITPLAVSGGTKTCGTGYCIFKHVKVSRLGGTTYAEFYADFELIDGAYDLIDRVYDSYIAMVGTYSDKKLTIVKKRENANGRAYAKLEWEGTTPGGYISVTYWLKLYVGKNNYSSAYSY